MTSRAIHHDDTILLVEDEEDHARLITRLLQEKAGVLNPIQWVKNGVEAIEYITNTGRYTQAQPPTPALVLLDMKLPLMNGFEVLRAIKTDDAYNTIPVIMLTTSSNSEDMKKARDLGANDYITKPAQFSDFIKMVHSLRDSWGLLSDATRAHSE